MNVDGHVRGIAARECLSVKSHTLPYIDGLLLWRAPRGVIITHLYIWGNKAFSELTIQADTNTPVVAHRADPRDVQGVKLDKPLIIDHDYTPWVFLWVSPRIDYLKIWYIYDDLTPLPPPNIIF